MPEESECLLVACNTSGNSSMKLSNQVIVSMHKYMYVCDLVKQCEVSLSRIFNDILTIDQLQLLPNRQDCSPIS